MEQHQAQKGKDRRSARQRFLPKSAVKSRWPCREGGADPVLQRQAAGTLIAKAKANNVPNDNIDRIIKKAAGEGDKNNYETIAVRGLRPQRRRRDCGDSDRQPQPHRVGDVRHYFDKFGGNLGTTGCVSFMFEPQGRDRGGKTSLDEDKAMEDVHRPRVRTITTSTRTTWRRSPPAPQSSAPCGRRLEGMGYAIVSAEVEQVPANTICPHR